MSSDAFTVVTRSRQVGIAVVIAALFVVPPIVRATSSFGSSSLIRLNRGFDAPPAKADVLSSLEQIADLISLRVPTESPAARRPSCRAASTVIGQAERTPDPERGPPASLF